MSITMILILFGVLLALLIGVNAIDQYRQRLSTERQQLLQGLSITIAENERLLANSIQLPMSQSLQFILLERNIGLMQRVLKMLPNSDVMQARLKDANEYLTGMDRHNTERPPLQVPLSDVHNAALIKTIKKIRHILSRLKAKGRISKDDYIAEDQVLEMYLLRIFVEYKMNQGQDALNKENLGTARQFYEKALQTLNGQKMNPDYVKSKEAEITEKLESIQTQLIEEAGKPSTLMDVSDADSETDDLDLLFFSDTKKKWDM